jgi:hypothetical protein
MFRKYHPWKMSTTSNFVTVVGFECDTEVGVSSSPPRYTPKSLLTQALQECVNKKRVIICQMYPNISPMSSQDNERCGIPIIYTR